MLKPTAVNSILAEIRQAQARGRTVISLMRGEPDFATPAHIVDAAAAALRGGPHALSGQSRRDCRCARRSPPSWRATTVSSYDPGTEILVTTGATLGIHAALMALLNDGDEVLLPDPIYDAYQSPILLCRRARPLRAARRSRTAASRSTPTRSKRR